MQTTSFAALLAAAVTEPGTIHQAYTAFHNYSLGNQLLALMQCHHRGIAPGPIATFVGWKDRGRWVRRGEKALTLCQPVTIKRKASEAAEEEAAFTKFVYRNNWFVVAQTEGNDITPDPVPGWSKDLALAALSIEEVPFALLNGNVQGYAQQRQVAVSSVAALPFKTLIHEVAHVVLGHTVEDIQTDGANLPRDLREVEAECVAMLVCAALGQPGVEYSRGYIQSWYEGEEIPERNAQRILKAADAILKAGRECPICEGTGEVVVMVRASGDNVLGPCDCQRKRTEA
jgi:hypothetical protein